MKTGLLKMIGDEKKMVSCFRALHGLQAEGARRQGCRRGAILVLPLLLCVASAARGQDNYEIQVYGSETVAPGETMIELHSNFTVRGSTSVDQYGVLPTEHAWHETIEITHGFSSWFETGFYLFTSARSGSGWHYVGSHIRPRVRAPTRWRWPVGASLSAEFGFQRRRYAANTWTVELRPIIDKQLGRWYLSFNPTLEKALRGPDAKRGWEFSPNAKVDYGVTREVAVGVEYYGALGPLLDFDPLHDQQQQFFGVIDLDVSPKWELNFGIGVGATASTDHLLIKAIVGRRWRARRERSNATISNKAESRKSFTALAGAR